MKQKFFNKIFSIFLLFIIINTNGLCCLTPLPDEDLSNDWEQDVILYKPHRTFYESFYVYCNGDPEIIYGKKSQASSYSRLSKIAALYVGALNALDTNTYPTLNKIFKKEYKDEELQKKKDIEYSPSNFLDPITISFLEKTHLPFLNAFLTDDNIQQVNNFKARHSLMLMSHDIRVTKESLTTIEKAKEMPAVISAVGKLYLVMHDLKNGVREVLGNGTGTFVKNEKGRDFILSCAHFPQSMGSAEYNYDYYAFEMFFFPHYLLDQKKNWPIGTSEVSSIPFEKYEALKVTGIHYPMDTLVKRLGEKELTYVPSLSDKDIPYLRKVKEGKKDFACFLEKTPEKVVPMQFADFSSHSESKIYYACGYPCWGMSDNTFIITEGNRTKVEANKVTFSFPLLHGMSGGPVFVLSEEFNQPVIIGILMGVDNTSLQAIGYPIKNPDVEFLNTME